MAENPPLNRIYVLGYSANDRNYPIVSLNADPRVAGYKVPEDLSTCPDKRYPNHIFTGAQPLSGDERVRHVWEILPSPWVPFTRYDDDLGPIQGRRRSVKNEGQVAVLTSDKRTTYEAREGSAIVYTELEETWSIKTDEDGNSLFPIKDRDFYDASRGPVQERRQLFVPTGDEVGSLENINGVITQTSYEPYNEFLSFKIVQTYSVDGPKLVGNATNEEGQLVTTTTQRKGVDGYVAPSPTATKTVEATSEDAESLVERIVETPEVFSAKTFSVERADIIPEKFRVKFKTQTTQENVEGTATVPTLGTGELSKSEQQISKFVKRTSTTSRDLTTTETLTGYQFTTELGGGIAVITETYPYTGPIPSTPEFGTIADEVENLADGTNLRRQVKLPEKQYNINDIVEDSTGYPIDGSGNAYAMSMAPLRGQDYDEELDLGIPYTQIVVKSTDTALITGNRRRSTPRDVAHTQVLKYDVNDVQDALNEYYWEIPDMVTIELPDKLISVRASIESSFSQDKSESAGDTYAFSVESRSSSSGVVLYDIEQGFRGNIPAIRCILFLPKGSSSPADVLTRLKTERNNQQLTFWPNARPQSHELAVFGGSSGRSRSESVSFDSYAKATGTSEGFNVNQTVIPPTIHPRIEITSGSGQVDSSNGTVSLASYVRPNVLESTEIPVFPTGEFIYQINASPYKFSYTRIDALIVEVTEDYI